MEKAKEVAGFLHAEGRRMVNGNGETVILRGWGTGNWMNLEGYSVTGIPGMYGFGRIEEKLVNNIRFDRSRTVASGVRELAGTAYTETFWPRWYRTHLREADIRAMAEMGFNSVRLAMDAAGFLYEEPGIRFNEDSFAMLGDVLDWCEKWSIYAILDLHAAPGGQSGVGCDNGIDNKPHTFTEPESRERTLRLWEEFADRYKDRWIVGGYELLNEPVSPPPLRNMQEVLRSFYEDAIARIRKIDEKHMFILQPPAFAHDMAFLDRGFDPEYNNWAYSVHMYWFTPEMKDFYQYLEPSRRLNVPVWIGEGRGTPASMAVFYDMVAEYGVGFNLFNWKNMKDIQGAAPHGICNYPVPEGWEPIMKYIAEGGPRPSYEESQKLLDKWIEASRFENCDVDWEMSAYALRRQGITIPAAGYDSIGGQGVSFFGTWREGNVYGYRAEDQIKMVTKPGAPLPNIFDRPINGLENLTVELREGEFVSYSVNGVVSDKEPMLVGTAKTDVTCEITVGQESRKLQIPAGNCRQTLMSLPMGDRATVKICVIAGELAIDCIEFPVK